MAVRVATGGDAVGRTIAGAGDRLLVTTGIREDALRSLYLETVFPPR